MRDSHVLARHTQTSYCVYFEHNKITQYHDFYGLSPANRWLPLGPSIRGKQVGPYETNGSDEGRGSLYPTPAGTREAYVGYTRRTISAPYTINCFQQTTSPPPRIGILGTHRGPGPLRYSVRQLLELRLLLSLTSASWADVRAPLASQQPTAKVALL
ncbi:hypothetical protein LZ30DRAFT_774258 [Colletotrichum cereale]|nr:hypothetical protein LZ30DRAFT_774258 [Colletotrichum cereale]